MRLKHIQVRILRLVQVSVALTILFVYDSAVECSKEPKVIPISVEIRIIQRRSRKIRV